MSKNRNIGIPNYKYLKHKYYIESKEGINDHDFFGSYDSSWTHIIRLYVNINMENYFKNKF